MARSHGRILTSIWDDVDFLNLDPLPQRMFLFLVSQQDLEHSGVIPLRERRWARGAAGIKPGMVADDLKVLAKENFIVVDEETEELLVRSLIRRDGVWKQPNVFKSAADHIRGVKSHAIKSALYAELARLDLASAHVESRRIRDELVAYLAPYAQDTGTPREPLGNPSGTPRDGLTDQGGRAQGNGEYLGGSVKDSPTPFPEPRAPSPPAPTRGTRLANGLLDEHLAACKTKPNRTVVAQTGDAIDRLLADPGITPEMISAGLKLMRSRPGKGPGLLPHLVDEARDLAASGNSRASPGRRQPHQAYRNPDNDDVYDEDL
jgi:hypothetical protein